MDIKAAFDFSNKVAVITGGGGVLCSTIGRQLAACGATVAVVDLNVTAAAEVCRTITQEGGAAVALEANVLDKKSLTTLAETVVKSFGKVDILINGAGGNKKEATTSEALRFADLPEDAMRWVFDLNFMGTFLACQVFGPHMFKQDSGTILNFSSMSALGPLTRTPAYSAAKAAVTNFTYWLAVHISHEYSKKIRVNALIPGFFLTEQNRYLMMDVKTGALTERGQRVVDHIPMERLGAPEDLVGPALALLSDGLGYVHGTTLIVDGGMSAYSGV